MSTQSIKLEIYVNYPGTCEEAFRFYEQHLGGKIIMTMKHGDQPGGTAQGNWKDKVLHSRLQIGGTALLGADIPNAEPMRSAYLTLQLETVEETERIYALLAAGGEIFMKMEETFYAERFAMLRDRFGTSWMLIGGSKAG